MTETETREVEMAPGIAAYRNQFRHILVLRWIRDSGDEVARHGQIIGWCADPQTGEQWLRFRPTSGTGKAIRIPAQALQRHLEQQEQDQRLVEATRVERCEECGKVLGSGRIGHLDENVPGLCFNCA